MFFSAEDDDQDFVSGGSKSRLANLFGIDKQSSQGGNESLTYTAPKQPRPKEPAPQTEGAPGVLFASAVNAYKYVDGKYATQGKLGAAILANHTSLDYRILLYVSKQQQVTNAKITTAFTFTVQPNNYAIIYDDSRLTWSLNFDSEQNVQLFAKNVALAKALSAGSALETVISQDLNVGEGSSSVETGSSVEVKYTGWLLTNNTFGQEFDSNAKSDKMFRFQTGKGKVIKGWDTGVVGMKKGTKRILVVPPSFGYGSKGAGSKIPPNSTLIFEITIMRIKGAKGVSPSPSPVPDSTPSHVDDQEEHTVKERTKSISDQMSGTSTSKSGKARLISKMAKMGQPILPMMGGATPVEVEDDSGEEEEGSIEPQSPQPIAESPPQHHATKPKFTKPKPVHAHPSQPVVQTMPQQYIQQQQPGMSQPAFVQNLPVAQQMAVYQPQQGFTQPQMQPQASMGQFPAGQPPMYNPQYQQQPEQLHTQSVDKTAPDTQILPVLTENRQQTTELRISMGKVSDKVERILEKVESMQNQQNGQLSLQSTQPNMEASVLMHNVQRIVQENDRLRKDGYDKSSKIESLNNKISELLQTNQQFVEKSQTLIEQRNEGFISTASQSQSRVLALEQEKVQLTTELANATSLYSNLQLEVTNLRKKEIEYQQKMGLSSNDSVRLQEELEALKNQKIDDSQKITELSTNFKEERQRRKHFESQISQIQEEFNDIKSSKENLEKNLSDRKRKATEEKRAMEEEFEENKEQMEREIQTLRDKLRKAKSSTDVATAEQVSQVEEELNREWKEKCDKMMTAQQEKHKRALQEMRQENEELQTTIQQLEKKIQEIKSSSGGTESQITELQEQIEEMTVWKDKYENLRNQATGMKDKYEDRISELETERDQMEEERDEALERAQKQQEVRVPSGGGGGDASNQSVVGEVKKIMNTVYQELKNKFESDETYTGADVLGAILNSIKSTTLKLVQSQSAAPKQEIQEESEEESEEEEDDEDPDEDPDGDQEEGVQGQDKKVVDQDEEDEEESDEDDEDVKDNVKEEKKNDVSKPAESELTQSENTEMLSQDPQNIPEDLPEVSNEMENNIETDQSAASVVENTQENVPDVNSDNNVVKDEQEKESNHDEKEIINEMKDQQIADSNTEPNKTENKKNVDSDIGSKAKVDLSDFDIPKIEKNNKPVVPPAASMEPPPIFDEEPTQQNNTDSLFGDDNHVEDTLGISFNKDETKDIKKKSSKVDLLDDDLKPQPPPPLFGDDDDDDDDLDWLS